MTRRLPCLGRTVWLFGYLLVGVWHGLAEFRYTIASLGSIDGPSESGNWTLTDDGRVLGFHQSMVLGEPGSVPTGGGGYVWKDEDGNGFRDEPYVNAAGSLVVERHYFGVAAGQPGARLMDLNESGQIAGTVYGADWKIHFARWGPDGLFQLGPEGAGGGQVINAGGWVLDPIAARVWLPAGGLLDLRDEFERDARVGLPEGDELRLLVPVDLNDDGLFLVTGSRSTPGQPSRTGYYLWRRGFAPQDLGVQPLGTGDLNNEGQAVLMTLIDGRFTTVLRGPNASGTLETFDLGQLLGAPSLNDHGQVIGNVRQGGATIPVVWDRQAGLLDLNALVAGRGNVILTNALRINDFGQILCLGESGGQGQVFLLSPKLGLDRWWGVAGDPQPVSFTWTVRYEGNRAPGTLSPDFATLSGWNLSSSALVVRRSNGFEPEQSVPFDFANEADVGELSRGTYQFHIDGMRLPTEPDIEPITFRLFPGNARLESLWVADRAELDAGTVFSLRLDGVEVTVTGVASLIGMFRPIFHHDPGDFLGPWDVQATWGSPEVPTESNPSWCGGEPVVGEIRQTMSLSRFGLVAESLPRCGNQSVVPPAGGVVYATVLIDPSPARLSINYFFHYPRSSWGEVGGFNTHEGDWEGISVFFFESNGRWEPLQVAYSQHEYLPTGVGLAPGGVCVPWAEVWRNPSTGGDDLYRPYVFVGRGGHASYPRRGSTVWYVPVPYVEAHFGGVVVDNVAAIPLPRLGRMLPEDLHWAWLRYPGRWGRTNINADWVAGNDGPPGPVFLSLGAQSYGIRWLTPWAWQSTFCGLEPAAPSTLADHFDELTTWLPRGNAEIVGDGKGLNRLVSLSGPGIASLTKELELPGNATFLTFDYRFVPGASAAELRLKLDGTVVGSVSAHAGTGRLRTTPLWDVAGHAGRRVTVEIEFVAGGGAGSAAQIDDFTVLVNEGWPPVIRRWASEQGRLTVSWFAAPGRTYQLEATADLAAGNWTAMGVPIIASGPAVTVEVPVDSADRRFFRVTERR